MTPLVLREPLHMKVFRLYIVSKEKVIGSMLTQVFEGKVHAITYLSWRLLDDESRCSFVYRLCLSLYYDCTKL
jgi:hypothetical protein